MHRMLIYDWKQGMQREWMKLLLFIFFLIGNNFVYLSVSNYCYSKGLVAEKYGFIEYWIQYFAGCGRPDLSIGLFYIPTTWMFVILMLCYIATEYVNDDISGFGVNIMHRAGRVKWWLSKFIWAVSITIFYVGMLLVSLIIVAHFSGGEINIWGNDVILEDMLMWDIKKHGNMLFFVSLYVLPVLALIALVVWQSLLAVILGAIESYIIIAGYIIVGIFYTHELLIGNHMMIYRSIYIETESGISPYRAVFIDVVLIIAALVIGMIYMSRFEIYEKNSKSKGFY